MNNETDRPIFFAPEEFRVGIAPTGNVALALGKPGPSLGFAPDLVFAAELTPDEARTIARLLLRKADEAEGAQPPGH
jgi:hypothetical protein